MKRRFSPYELTQLGRAHIDPDTIADSDTRPVEYITGQVTFADLPFVITEAALIPRIESEWLVNRGVSILSELLNKKESISVLELGTGSGAISISIAAQLSQPKQVTFMATDISGQALALAKANAITLLGADHQIAFLESDLFAALPQQQFDLIIANLPYIPEERIDYLDASVKDHEPFVALSGGSSGFELIEKMLTQAQPYLSMQGIILLEIDHTHTGEIWQPLKNSWNITLELDEFSRNRFAIVTHLK